MNKQQLEELLDQALLSKNEIDKKQFQHLLYEETYDLVAAKVKRYFPFMVDDICQEVYANKILVLSLEKVKEKVTFLESYLTVLVKNYCLKLKKKERFFIPLDAALVEQIENVLVTVPVIKLKTEQYYIKFLAHHLPPRQAKIIQLRVFERYRFDVIRYRMDLASSNAARQLFFQAKRKLQKVL